MQPVASTATTDSSNSLIERVLRLRQQMGIDIPLSIREPQDNLAETATRRDWLVWSQSPNEGNRPGKG